MCRSSSAGKDVHLDLCARSTTASCGWTRALSPAAQAVCTTASVRRLPSSRAAPAAAATLLSVYPASQPIMMELVRTGVISDLMAAAPPCARLSAAPASAQATCPPTGTVHPPHHPQLPQPRGLQARQWPAGGRGPDGCPQHCGHHGQRRHPDPGHRHRLRSHRAGVPVRRVQYDTRVYQGFGKADLPTPCSSWAPTSRTGPRSHRSATNLLLKVAPTSPTRSPPPTS